jgi:hypothetical protein
MGEIIAVLSCSVFAITCKCVLHGWSRGLGGCELQCDAQATTRSKLRGVLAERVHVKVWAYLFLLVNAGGYEIYSTMNA